jgi:hypothetical protein
MDYQNRHVIYMVRVIPAGPAQLQYPQAGQNCTITIPTGQPVCNRLVVTPATLNYRRLLGCLSSIVS